MVSGMQKLMDMLNSLSYSVNAGQVIQSRVVQKIAELAKAQADRQRTELEAINAVLAYVAGSGPFADLNALKRAFPSSQFIKDHSPGGSSTITIPEMRPPMPSADDKSSAAAEYRKNQTLFASEADTWKTVLQNQLNDATNLVTKTTQALEGTQQTSQNLRTLLSDILAILQAFLQVLGK